MEKCSDYLGWTVIGGDESEFQGTSTIKVSLYINKSPEQWSNGNTIEKNLTF